MMKNSNGRHGDPLQLQDPHIAVLAFPFSSHAGHLLSVVRRLASAAPSTTLFSFFNTRTSNLTLFGPTGAGVPENIKPYDVPDGVPEGYVFQGKHQEDIGLFLSAGCDGFRAAMEIAAADSGRRITCMLVDPFLWYTQEIAAEAEMHVPWVVFWTGGLASLSSHLNTDLIREKLDVTKGIAGREDEPLSFIPGMSKMRLKDLPEGVLFGNLESPFSNILLQMGRAFPTAAAVAVNSFEELEPDLTQQLKSDLPNLLCIGGPMNLLNKKTSSLPSDDQYGCLAWLDARKPSPPSSPVAYISFGSVTVPRRVELVAIAEALEVTGVPFIWSLKRESWDQNLPEGFLERTRGRGLVVPWAPQVDILSHEAVGAFVTHCGWGSFIEGLAAGVPMICRPFFGDQRLNGRIIQDVLEIGTVVDGGVITRDGLVRQLGMVLAGEEGRRMRENIKGICLQARAAVEGPLGRSAVNFNKLLNIILTQ
ncbi:hypothetical protein SAY87_021311 [Trapa incisa]|uniref:Glycosyltransferase n=1 Tax=Trapa incisa TaxID=236973 RepID=A0AAN7JWY6_9MYRT|nr:hypothetical protein SAY87_021311 [Trapa incisa]